MDSLADRHRPTGMVVVGRLAVGMAGVAAGVDLEGTLEERMAAAEVVGAEVETTTGTRSDRDTNLEVTLRQVKYILCNLTLIMLDEDRAGRAARGQVKYVRTSIKFHVHTSGYGKAFGHLRELPWTTL